MFDLTLKDVCFLCGGLSLPFRINIVVSSSEDSELDSDRLPFEVTSKYVASKAWQCEERGHLDSPQRGM
jgi:hypothetical protein